MRLKNTILWLLFVSLFSPMGQVKAGDKWVDGIFVGGVCGAMLGVGVGYYLRGEQSSLFHEEKFENESFSSVEVKDKSFSDFIGHKYVVEQAKEFVDMVFSFEDAAQEGVSRVKGLFIQGDRKSGKLLLASIIAAELGALMFHVPSTFFTDGSVWEIDGKIQYVFDFAKSKARKKRVVVFIENFDELLQFEGIEEVLQERFAAIEENKNLIVIGEVEGLNTLSDDVLWSIGMEQLQIFTPNLQGRKEMLEYLLSCYEVETDILGTDFLDRIARRTQGVHFDFFQNFVEAVARCSVKRKSGVIQKEHFEEVLNQIITGPKRDIVQEDEERMTTACHEAGHTLVSVLTGKRVYSVSIKLTEKSLGTTLVDSTSLRDDTIPGNLNKEDLLREIMIFYGGPCAEDMVSGTISVGCVGDLEVVVEIANDMVKNYGMGSNACAMVLNCYMSSEETAKMFDKAMFDIVHKCKDIVKELLERYKTVHERLSLLLYEKEELDEDEIYEITGEPRDEVTPLLSF